MAGNPGVGVDAVIIFDTKGNLKMVVPEEFEIFEDEPIKWAIEPQNQATVSFDPNHNPMDGWVDQTGDKVIEGKIKQKTKAQPYKYSVTDSKGNTIDPQIRVRK
jgi:hypothetical protein